MKLVEILKVLIAEGKDVLATAFDQDDAIYVTNGNGFVQAISKMPPVIYRYVEDSIFNKWYEKVNLILTKYGYESSIVKPNTIYKNYDIARIQLDKLKSIYELLLLDDSQNFEQNNIWNYLPENVVALFKHEHYSEAVFEAFKYIEDQVRKKSSLEDKYGTDLMRKAFHCEDGILTNKKLPNAERQSQMELFSGAIGFIKNPKSHKVIELTQNKANELLHFANYLLRILNGEYSKIL